LNPWKGLNPEKREERWGEPIQLPFVFPQDVFPQKKVGIPRKNQEVWGKVDEEKKTIHLKDKKLKRGSARRFQKNGIGLGMVKGEVFTSPTRDFGTTTAAMGEKRKGKAEGRNHTPRQTFLGLGG